MMQVTVKATFHSDIQKVWDAVLDVEHYAAAKPFLKKRQARFIADLKKALGEAQALSD